MKPNSQSTQCWRMKLKRKCQLEKDKKNSSEPAKLVTQVIKPS
jgi:hypothetical protein